MRKETRSLPVVIVLVASLVLSACGGCHDDGGGRLKLSPIYQSALWGAAIGGIIGHQSDEAEEGAALGAAVFGIGELLQQTDKMHDKKREHKHEDQEQEVVIQIQNQNGSTTPVVLKKKGGTYLGPNGEHYNRLPTAEQLQPVYGL